MSLAALFFLRYKSRLLYKDNSYFRDILCNISVMSLNKIVRIVTDNYFFIEPKKTDFRVL